MNSVEWGIANINADDVWSQYGVTGENVVIANIDTRCSVDHPALVNQYCGNNGDGTFTHDYNCFDAAGACATAPCDSDGHGTHTMGTMARNEGGANQIGVAPGVKWPTDRQGCPDNNRSSMSRAHTLTVGGGVAAGVAGRGRGRKSASSPPPGKIGQTRRWISPAEVAVVSRQSLRTVHASSRKAVQRGNAGVQQHVPVTSPCGPQQEAAHMTLPTSPPYPAPSAPQPPPRRGRTGLFVVICVFAVLLAGGGVVVWRLASNGSRDDGDHGGSDAQGGTAPAGFVTLPDGCDLLPPAEAAKLLPNAGNGSDQGSQDAGWGVTRRCAWGGWDDAAQVGRSLDIQITAMLDPVQDTPTPNTDAAIDEVRAPIDDERTHPVTITGADEAYLGEPEQFGDKFVQELLTRYQNVVVDINYDPGEPIDPAMLTGILTTSAEQVVRALEQIH